MADADAVARVLTESFLEYRDQYTAEGYRATTPDAMGVLQRIREGPVWVAVTDGVVQGTVAAYRKASRCHIRGMAIVSSARGQGIGGFLLRAVEEFAMADGAAVLLLSTTPFLDRAIRLYRHNGFERSDDGPHDLFGTPLFTMKKQLRAAGSLPRSMPPP